MRKKRFNMFLAVFVGAFCALVSFGCAQNKKGPADTSDPDPTPQYTVTYHYNYDGSPNGGVYTTQTVDESDRATKPATDPTRSGYVFVNWYTDADCATEYSFATPVTSAIDLYAGWEENATAPTPQYTVTYHYNYVGAPNGCVYTTQTVEERGTATKPVTDPTRSGYSFIKWYADAACTIEYGFATPVTSAIDLYAGWEENAPAPMPQYTVTYHFNFVGAPNGGVYTTQKVEEDGTATKPVTDPTRSGYSFTKWYADAACTIEYDFATPVTAAKDIYAGWEENAPAPTPQYTVTYHFNFVGAPNGGVYTTQEVEENGTATKPANDPTRLGYTFGGWYTDAACDDIYDLDAAVTSDFTLYAKWTIINYAVEYIGGGNTSSANPASINIDSADFELVDATPTEVGYYFVGWYTAQEGGDKVSTLSASMIDGNTDKIVLYARFANEYTVAFDSNVLYDTKNEVDGGSMPSTQTVSVYNQELTIENPVRGDNGEYVFGGWFKDKECTEQWGVTDSAKTVGNVTSSMTLYAKWIAQANGGNNVAVTYNNCAPSDVTATVEYYAAGSAVTLETPTAIGYMFGGWYTDAACTTPFDTDKYTVWQEHTELFGKWDALGYTVTYILPVGAMHTNSAAYSADDGEVVLTAPTAIVGKTFVCWSTVDGDITKAVTTVNVALFGNNSTVTLYAIYDDNTYTVTIDYNDDATASKVLSVVHGDKVARPTDPTRDGHRFLGWYVGDEQYDFDSVVTADIDITAKWVKLHTVTFVYGTYDGAPENYVVEAEDGKPAVMPQEPTRADHTFVKWSDGNGGEFTSATVVVGDTIVYAEWKETTVNVTFDGNGGILGDKDVVEIELKKSTPIGDLKPADPIRAGYRFLGWFVGDEEYTDFDANIDADTVLTAKWAQEFTVTLYWNYEDAPDDGVIEVQTVVDGGYAVRPQTDPVRDEEMYSFNGWFADASGSAEFKFDTAIVTADTSVYAKWTKLSQGFMEVLSDGVTAELRMLDNTEHMQGDEQENYDLNFAFFGESKVTLKAGDILTFKIEGSFVSFTLDTYSTHATLVDGTPTALEIMSDGEYEMYLKRSKATKEWEIYISGGDPIEDDRGRTEYVAGIGYIVGQFDGDETFEWGKGYPMTYNAEANYGDGEWEIEIELKAGEIVKFRLNDAGYGYTDIEDAAGSAKANFAVGSDNNIIVNVDGTYQFYFKPTNYYNKIWVQTSSDGGDDSGDDGSDDDEPIGDIPDGMAQVKSGNQDATHPNVYLVGKMGGLETVQKDFGYAVAYEKDENGYVQYKVTVTLEVDDYVAIYVPSWGYHCVTIENTGVSDTIEVVAVDGSTDKYIHIKKAGEYTFYFKNMNNNDKIWVTLP